MRNFNKFKYIFIISGTNNPETPFSLKCKMYLVFTGRQKTNKDRHVKTNKDRHILSAAQNSGMESSFRRYKVCADIRSGSLERRR